MLKRTLLATARRYSVTDLLGCPSSAHASQPTGSALSLAVRPSDLLFILVRNPGAMGRYRMIAQAAAVVAAVLALVAAISSAAALPSASVEVLVAELWRTVGLMTWAALFALLAVRPGLLAVWVIALSSKLALVIGGLLIGYAVPGASDLVLWDGVLSVVLAVGAAAAARMRALERADG